MNMIARALEVGHPAAYLLIFLILGEPLIFIGMYVYDEIKERNRKKKDKKISH